MSVLFSRTPKKGRLHAGTTAPTTRLAGRREGRRRPHGAARVKKERAARTPPQITAGDEVLALGAQHEGAFTLLREPRGSSSNASAPGCA